MQRVSIIDFDLSNNDYPTFSSVFTPFLPMYPSIVGNINKVLMLQCFRAYIVGYFSQAVLML